LSIRLDKKGERELSPFEINYKGFLVGSDSYSSQGPSVSSYSIELYTEEYKAFLELQADRISGSEGYHILDFLTTSEGFNQSSRFAFQCFGVFVSSYVYETCLFCYVFRHTIGLLCPIYILSEIGYLTTPPFPLHNNNNNNNNNKDIYINR
jgi:hypothetical protein